MPNRVKRLLAGTLRRQLLLSMVLIVSSTMLLFIWDLTERERRVELGQQSEQAVALASSVATSSAVWVASRDFSGLQEIVAGISKYPDLRHAIVLDLVGQVLAHSDRARRGQYLSDLPQKAELRVMQDQPGLVDIASPVMLGSQHIGWVRIGLSRDSLAAKLATIRWNGVIYAFLATALCMMISALAARYLTRRLHAIQQVADAVQAGNSGARVALSGTDEAAQLGHQFNAMLDALVQREHELMDSKELTEAIIENVPLMIFLKEAAELKFVMFNRAGEELVGHDRKEFLGKNDQDHFPPEQAAHFMANDRQVLAGEVGMLDIAEEPILTANKGQRLLHTRKVCIRDSDGSAKYLLGISEDITERKASEERLRESEERYRTAFLTSPDAVTVTRLSDGLYLEVSEGFERMLGWTRDETLGRSSLELNIWHKPDDRARLLAALRRDGYCDNQEAQFIAKDGRLITGLMSAHPMAIKGEPCLLSVTRDISARKAAEYQIQQLAFYDPLTRLPNRRLLIDRLQQDLAASTRHHRQSALLLVDLDNFKDLNDVLGHAQGDLALQQVAHRLGRCTREGDTVARLGADEFVLLLAQLNQNPLEAAMEAETVGHTVLDALKQPYQIDGSEVSCTASIGITLFGEQNEDTVEPLKRAELAMYQAKAHGRNTLRFFDPQMQAVVNARVAMEAGLRDAVGKDQLLLHYQAQVTDQGQITGAEALLRWQDPKRGLVSPAEFIPIAEETGLILPIGNWVLETACGQLAQWASQPAMAHLTVAVNVSARQFHQRDFADQVLMALERTGANPHRLKLELTESVLVTDVEGVIIKMSALKGRGVTFSLDDFGTGYSSLSYLKRLPLDQLKIDQGFVRDILINPNDAAIARMVIALAGSMGLTVIPEGVETQAQRDFLAALGCHNFQGYLFSRPLPIREFEAFVQSRSVAEPAPAP